MTTFKDKLKNISIIQIVFLIIFILGAFYLNQKCNDRFVIFILLPVTLTMALVFSLVFGLNKRIENLEKRIEDLEK